MPISAAHLGYAIACFAARTVKHSEAPFPLLSYRIDQRIQKLKSWFRKEGPRSFSTLLVASAVADAGLSYRLPDHLPDERSGKW